MPRIPFQVRGLILRSAKEEFLSHGFEGASLRSISKRAGLTTGAFYNHFSRKEELFEALVAPMIEEFQGLYGEVMSRELEDLDTGVDNELTSISYAIAHRDEFHLLFECSRGTQYEGFRDRLIDEVFCCLPCPSNEPGIHAKLQGPAAGHRGSDRRGDRIH